MPKLKIPTTISEMREFLDDMDCDANAVLGLLQEVRVDERARLRDTEWLTGGDLGLIRKYSAARAGMDYVMEDDHIVRVIEAFFDQRLAPPTPGSKP